MIKSKECESWHEWYNTGGMGETCMLSLGHDGEHHGNSGGTWAQSADARRLLPELNRLKRRDAAMRDFVDELLAEKHIVGHFIAREIMTRLGAADGI